MRLDGDGQRELVDEVDRRARHDGSAAQVLQAEHSVGPPELLHAVSHQNDSRQLGERLDHVEVTQRAHFKESHAVLLGVRPRLLCGDLALERQVQPVPDQDPRHTRGMLIDLPDPPVDSIKGPPVSDVIDQQDALSTTRI